MPGWLAIEDMTTPQVAAATPNVCKGDNGSINFLESIVKLATMIVTGWKVSRKRDAATVGGVDGGLKHRVVQSLRHTGLHLPADFSSTPEQFGCTGCGKCRYKKDMISDDVGSRRLLGFIAERLCPSPGHPRGLNLKSCGWNMQ